MIEPNYYKHGGFDVIDFGEMKFGVDAAKAFCKLNVIKYLTRYEEKNGIEDLQKAQTYMTRLIEIERKHNLPF